MDNVDGDISDIGVSGTVDENAVGSYTITYSATDSAGNKGATTRTVNVKDTTAPVITVIGDNPATRTGSTYIEDGAAAMDNVDGDISDIGVSGTVDENAVGSYTITYSATDSAGNKGTATRTVNVKDTTAL